MSPSLIVSKMRGLLLSYVCLRAWSTPLGLIRGGGIAIVIGVLVKSVADLWMTRLFVLVQLSFIVKSLFLNTTTNGPKRTVVFAVVVNDDVVVIIIIIIIIIVVCFCRYYYCCFR